MILAYGILASGSILLRDTTKAMVPIQSITTIKTHTKKNNGTARILLVPQRKSAEASMQSIAARRELQKQQMQHKKASPKTPKTTAPAIN